MATNSDVRNVPVPKGGSPLPLFGQYRISLPNLKEENPSSHRRSPE
jgi:hypothetical protein